MKRIRVVVCGLAVILALTGRAADKDPGAVTADQRKQVVDKLKQIGIGLQNYHDTFMQMPKGFVAKDGTPLLSWRVAILPYIEEWELFLKFKANEPWDSESNKKLIEKMPKVFESVRKKGKPGETFYQGFFGKGTAFDPDAKVEIYSVANGPQNTLALVESANPVIWTKPTDIPFGPKEKIPMLGGQIDDEFYALFLDGHVERLKDDIDAKSLKTLITTTGGESIDLKTLRAKD